MRSVRIMGCHFVRPLMASKHITHVTQPSLRIVMLSSSLRCSIENVVGIVADDAADRIEIGYKSFIRQYLLNTRIQTVCV